MRVSMPWSTFIADLGSAFIIGAVLVFFIMEYLRWRRRG